MLVSKEDYIDFEKLDTVEVVTFSSNNANFGMQVLVFKDEIDVILRNNKRSDVETKYKITIEKFKN